MVDFFLATLKAIRVDSRIPTRRKKHRQLSSSRARWACSDILEVMGRKTKKKGQRDPNLGRNRKDFTKECLPGATNEYRIMKFSPRLEKGKKNRFSSMALHFTLNTPFTSTDLLIHSTSIYWMPARHKEGTLRESQRYEREAPFPWRSYSLVGMTEIRKQ